MTGNLLKIKTTIPPLGKNILPRPQLAGRLNDEILTAEGFTRPLTLFSAPAGFGKTTLVRKWLSGKEDRTAWLSLDGEDNEPERFWVYLMTALQVIDNNIAGEMRESLRSHNLLSNSNRDSISFLTTLLNDLFSLEHPAFLVLDDYHLINNPRIHEDIIFFIENLPPTLHLVTTTRSDPPWPLSKWRVKGKTVEIRLEELKFSEKEAGELFAGIKGLQLKEKQLSALYQKTEGWVTGLQLAAVSLASSRDKDQFIKNFAGNHRHILHFLSEEVIAQQPEPVCDFLLKTSILNRFNASLCNEVTEKQNSEELLARLDRENLFVIPLDEQGNWYRYHSLFADLLFFHLKEQPPEVINQLHQKASRWFFDSGEYGQAVHHALAADDFQEAARILHEKYDRVIYAEDPGQLNRGLDALPPGLLKQFPRLVVQKALNQLIYKSSRDAKPYIDLAENLEYESNLEQKEFTGMLDAVKTYYYIYSQQLPLGLKHADRALVLLPTHNYYWRMYVAIYSGDARLFSGNPKEAYPFYLEAHHNSEKMQNKFFELTIAFNIATCLYYLGRLKEAKEVIERTLLATRDTALSRVPRTGLLWGLLGELYREKGNLEEAERCVEKSLFFSEAEKPSLGWNSLFKVAVSFSKRDYLNALNSINGIETINQESKLPFFVTTAAVTWKSRILLELGDISRAGESLAQLEVTKEEEDISGGLERAYLILCRLLQVKNGYEIINLNKLINKVEKLALRGENKKIVLEIMLIRAMLEEQAGNQKDAEKQLKTALETGFSCGYFQFFLDEGKTLGPVLERIINQIKDKGDLLHEDNFLAYMEKIYRMLSADLAPGKMETEKETTPENYLERSMGASIPPISTRDLPLQQNPAEKKLSPELVDPLSKREMEVLELISQGLSNEAIAEKMFLSLGTVKWHTTNIYGKLGVRNRTRAVALARELNIIS